MTHHRTYYGTLKPTASYSYEGQRSPRTAGMRARTDAPIVPLHDSWLRRVVRWIAAK